MTIEQNLSDDVEIIDDVALDPDGERAKPAAKAKDELSPEVINSLKAQLAARDEELRAEREARAQEAQRRQEVEGDARKLADVATQAKRSAEASHYRLIESHISSAKSRTNDLKAQIRAANEAGDYEKVTELQMEAAKVATRLLQYEDAKADMEAAAQRQAKEPPPAETRKPDVQPQHSDPFEARIAGLTDTTKKWLREHRECVTDEVKSAEAVAADAKARREGLKPDTPEYFAFVEEKLGYRQPKAAEPDGEEIEDGVIVSDPKPVAKPATMTAAPVSRSGSGVNGAVTQIRLSRAQVEMAESLGMTPKEYHSWMIKAEKDGRYTN